MTTSEVGVAAELDSSTALPHLVGYEFVPAIPFRRRGPDSGHGRLPADQIPAPHRARQNTMNYAVEASAQT